MKTRVAMLFLAAAAAAVLAGCAGMQTITMRAYPGPERAPAELSTVAFSSGGFPDIYLYRVDGVPRTAAVANSVGATFSDMRTIGFSVAVPAGRHVLEFYNVHKTPFDKSPLNYQTIAFSTEAGKAYELSHSGSAWQLKCEGKAVESTMGKVPVLAPPAAGEPQATLVFDRADGPVVAYLFRVDGMISPTMSYFEPRWVAFNSPGTMPITIRNTAVPNIIHSPLVDPGYGKLVLPIAPGRHVLEYGNDYLPAAYRCMAGPVRLLEFEAEAGKTYKIRLGKPGADPTAGVEATIAAE